MSNEPMSTNELRLRLMIIENGGNSDRVFEILGETLRDWRLDHPGQQADGDALMAQAIARAKVEGVWETRDDNDD